MYVLLYIYVNKGCCFKKFSSQDDNDCHLFHFRLFNLLGTVFTFVTSDVHEKVGILRAYRQSKEAKQYETVSDMIIYEVENKLTDKKTKPLSGSRTLLRLHRALEFVIDFMTAVTKMEISKKLTGIASESYQRTLAKHHPWVIRKAVGVAMYTLPTGEQLLSKMGKHDVDRTVELINRVIQLAQPIYDDVQTIYTSNNLHNLP